MTDNIAFQAKLQPNRLALHELASDRKWDYAALDHVVAQCASMLSKNSGMAPGARVAMLAHNCAEHIILHHACTRAGLIFVPLNWRLSATEIVALLENAEPALLVGDDALDAIEFAGACLSVTELIEQINVEKPLPHGPIDKDATNLILYTSGTSGKPKGVLISERNLDTTAFNSSVLCRVTHNSVFLCDSPMFHILGLGTNVRPTFLRGAAVLVSDGFDPKRTLQRLADPALAVTHYFGVPQMAASLRQEESYDPDKLRGMTAIFTGGAPHPAADIRAWLSDGISVVDGFGMSEAGTVFGMSIERDIIDQKAGAVGVGTPAIDARIVDDADNDCETGQAGELLLRGDNISCGYWRQPEATALAFTEDGWFRTGDIAVQDADGFYSLVDRKKDMYISGGENVYPAEVESALAGIPGLIEASIVGVSDERWGEVGYLALVSAEGVSISMDDALAWLGPKLARYKLPKHFSNLAALPRTGSGKVQKNVLREQFESENK